MIKTLLACVVIFIPLVIDAQPKSTDDWARRDAFANPEKLDEKIIDSWAGGNWNQKGVTGSYKFIITEVRPGKEKLYVQWLMANGELAYSLSVKELNVRPEYDLELPQCLDGEACRKIEVGATHYYEKSERKFTILLDKLGIYEFGL